MYCYKENNIKKEVYHTNEDLNEVYEKKNNKIISKLKEMKIVNPKIEVSKYISDLQKLNNGTLLNSVNGFTYQIVKKEDYLFIYKDYGNYRSIRFWSVNDNDDFEERMKNGNI